MSELLDSERSSMWCSLCCVKTRPTHNSFLFPFTEALEQFFVLWQLLFLRFISSTSKVRFYNFSLT